MERRSFFKNLGALLVASQIPLPTSVEQEIMPIVESRPEPKLEPPRDWNGKEFIIVAGRETFRILATSLSVNMQRDVNEWMPYRPKTAEELEWKTTFEGPLRCNIEIGGVLMKHIGLVDFKVNSLFEILGERKEISFYFKDVNCRYEGRGYLNDLIYQYPTGDHAEVQLDIAVNSDFKRYDA